MSDAEPLNLDDLEERAREALSAEVYDFFAGGAGDEVTLRANRSAFERLALRYRVLVDVSERDTGTTVLGERVSLPVLLAPVAFQGLVHEDAEVATARAAAAAGTILVLSTLSNAPVEEVVEAAGGPVWFQLYKLKDRRATADLVERAGRAGCSALVLTVDAPRKGRLERDLRNRFEPPPDLVPRNLLPARLQRLPSGMKMPGAGGGLEDRLDASMTWDDLDWLRSLTDMPLLLKGVVRGDDAERAVERGVAGIVVSNHGGRQLDTAPPTIEVLEEVATAADGRCEVLVDGGIRRGTDVIKALALGARAALVGRPAVWGLALGGEPGVVEALEILRREIDLAMALCGVRSVEEIGRDLVSGRLSDDAGPGASGAGSATSAAGPGTSGAGSGTSGAGPGPSGADGP